MGFYGISVELCQVLWGTVGLYGVPMGSLWVSMGPYGSLWIPMGVSMGPYGSL